MSLMKWKSTGIRRRILILDLEYSYLNRILKQKNKLEPVEVVRKKFPFKRYA